jgi:hypothetical protein
LRVKVDRSLNLVWAQIDTQLGKDLQNRKVFSNIKIGFRPIFLEPFGSAQPAPFFPRSGPVYPTPFSVWPSLPFLVLAHPTPPPPTLT